MIEARLRRCRRASALPWSILAALLCLIPLTATGCGADPDESETAERLSAADLMKRLPAQFGIAGVDFVQVRSDLDLPADYDVAQPPVEPRIVDDLAEAQMELERRPRALAESTVRSYASFVLPQTRTTEEDPLLEAVDGSQITAAAEAGGDPPVAIFQTEQPFEEIASALTESGFEEENGVLVTNNAGGETTLPSVAGGEDGIVVLAVSPEQATAIAAGEEQDNPVTGLIDQVEGAALGAGVDTNDTCLAGFAFGEQTGGDSGVIALEIDGGPETGRLRLENVSSVEAGNPSVDGDVVTTDFDQSPGDFPVASLLYGLEEFPYVRPYACP